MFHFILNRGRQLYVDHNGLQSPTVDHCTLYLDAFRRVRVREAGFNLFLHISSRIVCFVRIIRILIIIRIFLEEL